MANEGHKVLEESMVFKVMTEYRESLEFLDQEDCPEDREEPVSLENPGNPAEMAVIVQVWYYHY